jgi:phage host-nuclease inhibitor protein Gam
MPSASNLKEILELENQKTHLRQQLIELTANVNTVTSLLDQIVDLDRKIQKLKAN